jgi:hypothetical protein
VSSWQGATAASRKRSRRASVRDLTLVVALLLAGAGAPTGDAFAQGLETDDSEEQSVDLSPPGEAPEEDDTNLAPAERVARGKQFVSTIDGSTESIQRQLGQAKEERDVVRVLCLNDKLNQVDVAQRSAQDRMAALATAAERGDADRTRHEYTVLEVLHDRVKVLVNESNQCVGEETGFIGEAEVSVSIDPNLPDADTGFGTDPYALPPLPNISSPIE